MKKYLREIELSGILLMVIGVVMYRLLNIQGGYVACGIGVALWLIVLIYKSFKWQEYRKDNIQNIAMMLLIIVLLLGSMIMAR